LDKILLEKNFLSRIILWGILLSSSNVSASWETRSIPHFFLNYQANDTHIADVLAAQVDAIYRTVTEDVGYAPQRRIFVYLCPTPECFHQKQPADTKLPEWAVGVAYPSLNRIVIRSMLTVQEEGVIQPVEIFKHEFAHIVLEQALAKRGGAPRWLSEGFSMYAAKQWTLSGERTLEEATLRKTFIPLTMLTTAFPADEKTARIAYAQSLSLVTFMLHYYGKPLFHQFLKNLQNGMDTDTALSYSTGDTLARLELKWQADLNKRYSWFSYLVNIGLFWFLLSVIVIIAYLIKYYRAKRMQARWEEEEAEEIQAANNHDSC
jgi:hypothetical protein